MKGGGTGVSRDGVRLRNKIPPFHKERWQSLAADDGFDYPAISCVKTYYLTSRLQAASLEFYRD